MNATPIPCEQLVVGGAIRKTIIAMVVISSMSLFACAEIPEFTGNPGTPTHSTSSRSESPASSRVLIAFAPLSGAPQATADQLAMAIGQEAVRGNLRLTASGDPSATYTVKGYLSSLPKDGKTTLVYVWDILAPDRRRLHRISGEVPGQATGAQPWQSVSPTVLNQIAGKTVSDLVAWINRS